MSVPDARFYYDQLIALLDAGGRPTLEHFASMCQVFRADGYRQALASAFPCHPYDVPCRPGGPESKCRNHGGERGGHSLDGAAPTVGLHRKYDVRRLDDTSGKHDGCWFFVLDPEHDRIARLALTTYATEAGLTGNALLATDIEAKLRELEGDQS